MGALFGGLATLLASLVRGGLALVPGIGPALAGLAGFFSTALGRYVALVLAGALLLLGGEIHGRLAERAKCRAADIAMQLAAAKRDSAIAGFAAATERAANDALARQQAALQRKVEDYEHALARRGAAACRLDSADVRRLRDIR